MKTPSALRTTVLVLAAVLPLRESVSQLARAWLDLSSAFDATVAEPAVVALARLVVAACVCWLLCGALLTVFSAIDWAGRPLARALAQACAPRCWRAGVLAAVGVGVLASPALAGAATPSAPVTAATSTSASSDLVVEHPHAPWGRRLLDGLTLPDRPSGRRRAGTPGQRAVVVVHRGDDLWSIAERSLPRHTPQLPTVALACTAWYAANADVIGPDPDLILPGTRLRAPDSSGAQHHRSPH